MKKNKIKKILFEQKILKSKEYQIDFLLNKSRELFDRLSLLENTNNSLKQYDEILGSLMSRISSLEQNPKTIAVLEREQKTRDDKVAQELLDFLKDAFCTLYDYCQEMYDNNFRIDKKMKDDIYLVLEGYEFLRDKINTGVK